MEDGLLVLSKILEHSHAVSLILHPLPSFLHENTISSRKKGSNKYGEEYTGIYFRSLTLG